VSTRTHDQEFFNLPLNQVWQMALEALQEAYSLHHINLVSFVLMSNHYHMLLITPHSNIEFFMYEFNKRFALKIKSTTTDKTPLFKSRYKWSVIRSRAYYANCYRYIYQNPIRAKLCEKAQEYPFSTLHYIAHGKNFPIPIFDQFGFKDQFTLEWINKNFSDDEINIIRKKFRRYIEPIKKN
jgi:putative transposase